MASGAGRPPWGTGVRQVWTCVCERENVCVSVSNGAINWPPRSIMRVPGLAPLGPQHTCTHAHLNERTHTHTHMHRNAHTPTQADVFKHENTEQTNQILLQKSGSFSLEHCKHCVHVCLSHIKTYTKEHWEKVSRLFLKSLVVLCFSVPHTAEKTASPSAEGKHFRVGLDFNPGHLLLQRQCY